VPEWEAEIEVDETLAQRLISGQFPEVETETLTLIGRGWDNTVWLAEHRWAFRFPRREIAVPLVARELATLPALAPRLPLAIPAPVFGGQPTDDYPWPFLGAESIPGREPAFAPLDDAARVRAARPLGKFLRALHGSPAPDELPEDPNGRANMTVRVEWTERRLAHGKELGLWGALPAAKPVLDAALAAPPTHVRVLTHGDLHFRHVLVDDSGALTGVIDWGDVGRSDPGIDLVLPWCLLPPDARPTFFEAYGGPPGGSAERGRLLALFLSATLAIYARDEGLPELEREAVGSLVRTLQD